MLGAFACATVARCFGCRAAGRKGTGMLSGPAAALRGVKICALAPKGSSKKHREGAEGAVDCSHAEALFDDAGGGGGGPKG